MISDDQRRALRLLAPHLPADAYLAGGVAVAYWLKHRASRDLDIFSRSDPNDRIHELSDVAKIESQADGTIEAVVENVPVSLLRYKPELLQSAHRDHELGVNVATPIDLGCMKLSAIAQRGAARDFWDLHALIEAGTSFETFLEAYEKKYPRIDLGHVLRSLVYFGEADSAPLPKGLSRSDWRAICDAFERRVKALP